MNYLLKISAGVFTCVVLLLYGMSTVAQVASGINERQYQSYTHAVDAKMQGLNQKLNKKTARYLVRLARSEKIILASVSKLDSATSSQLMQSGAAIYSRPLNATQSVRDKISVLTHGKYLPVIDSLSSSLQFLKEFAPGTSQLLEAKKRLEESLKKVVDFKNGLNNAEDIEQALIDRQRQLTQLLKNYPSISPAARKVLNNYTKGIYYYSQQLAEIKNLLKEPDKLIARGLSAVSGLPVFREFMSQHSILAALFPPTGSTNGVPNGLQGLQSRADIQQLMQRQMGSMTASNPGSLMQQNLEQAQGQLSKLKDRVLKLGNSKGNINMPAFKPNAQKTKSFWKRLEFGAGMQSQKATYYFPVRTDLSLSAGYKLSDSKVIGLGLSGKMGWGKNWKQIRITGEGLGARGYMECKLKGNFWLAGSAEMNYLHPIDSLEHFKNYSNWSRSALIGISKSYSISKKLKGKIQCLFDCLYRQNHPETEPIIFRLGYVF